MTQFRASSVGNCTRQIVLKHLEPGRFKVDEARRPFLDAGHNLQEAVEAFIQEQIGVLDLSRREEEGSVSNLNWGIVGHIDGMLDNGDLLEVKAIKAANFEKLAKTYDWRDQYGHYQAQAQAYQRMFDAPGTHFVYYNRNTSDMMGSLDIDHPVYTFRKDCYEPYDPTLWNNIIEKLDAATRYIKDGEAPPECDAKGYCYFCGVRGTEVQKKRTKRVSLLPDDDEYTLMDQLLGALEDSQNDLLSAFKEYNADEIHLQHGNKKVEILRKEDYEEL